MMTRDELVALLKKNAPDAVIVAASEIIDNDSTIAWPYMFRSEALLATGHPRRALGGFTHGNVY